ncbi:MAG TPA: glycosyltransferase 87 family protein [Terriglobales bacterium]|nr:glycosyltransferase 87 family protein [Terriglobales bacterium]
MFLSLAIFCAAGTWTYARRVLIPHQISDSAARGRPRGNLSDLYPRWIGARELLLHGRDPYQADVTREIQAGYYGRPLDASRPGDPIDQQGFAYPVYVVFYLAPAVRLDFAIVQRAFFWILVFITAAGVLLWLRVLDWRVSFPAQAAIVALSLGNLPVLQGLKLQQLTLLVAAMCAAAMALLVAGRSLVAGMVLALATIKPQLVLPLLLWLAIWSLSDLRRRYRWAASFLIVLIFLCAASELVLPHWVGRFWRAVGEYWQYTQATPMLEAMLGRFAGKLIEVLLAAITVLFCYRRRKPAEDSASFQSSTCLVLALTVISVPTFSLYNQVLLIPAILLIARDCRAIWAGGLVGRVLLILTSGLLAWQWLSAAVLAGLSFIVARETMERAWVMPLWAVPQIPLVVAGLLLIHYYRGTFTAAAKPRTS